MNEFWVLSLTLLLQDVMIEVRTAATEGFVACAKMREIKVRSDHR